MDDRITKKTLLERLEALYRDVQRMGEEPGGLKERVRALEEEASKRKPPTDDD